MKLPAYPRTKPSGVEWLGDVPEHWTPITLRRTSTRYAGGTPDRSNDSYWDEGTIPWINSGAVNQGLITEPSAFITEEAYRNSSARWVDKGALVMALAGQGKTKGMVAQTGIATTCNQSMAAICPAPPMEARYLYWLLVAQYEHIRNMAGGEARDGLNLEILGAIPCLKVPPAEQRSIAAYLDRETGRVDRLVAKKRELIERLKEKRTALISRTVTRGLPPAAARAAGLPANPPLKPSALDWLGDIPAHWEIWKHAHLFTSSMGQTILKEEVSDEGAIPVLSATEKYEIFGYLERAAVILEVGDLVIPARGNSIGHVKLVRERCTTTQTTIYSKHLTRKVSPAYAFYYLMGHRSTLFHFDRTAIPQLTVNQVSTNLFLLPSLPEQAAIAAYLDAETGKLDALVGKVEEAVERLQEYRTALITAAVTGKIDVRAVKR